MTMFYYNNKKSGNHRTYDKNTQVFSDVTNMPKGFHLFNGYENTDESLIQYAADFEVWNNELNNNKIFKIDYAKKFKFHYHAVETMFTKLLVDEDYTKFDEVDAIEFVWAEKCNNGAIMKQFCEQGKIVDSYGYDFKATYPFLLGSKLYRSLQMPTKRGKELTLTELDCNKLQVGYYRVKITSNDINFNKIFLYSKENVYTDISLYHAYSSSKTMKVNIEIIQDNKPNAYLYGKGLKDGIISPSKVFGKWFEVLTKLKDEFPQNKLVKHLMSSMWGHMCKFDKTNLTIDEVMEQDLNVSTDIYSQDCDYVIIDQKCKKNDPYYVLVNPKKPYKYSQIARLKPFLLSNARRCTANIMMLHLDNVIRVHTDNVTFDQKFDDVMTAFKTYPELRAENKTSGKIKWENVNDYKKIE